MKKFLSLLVILAATSHASQINPRFIQNLSPTALQIGDCLIATAANQYSWMTCPGASAGVTSVTASAPLASSGGATPNITLAALTSSTTIQKGNGSGLFSAANYADVFALFSACSGTMYPGYDGACHSPISSVTASAPLASSGGTTPNITLSSLTSGTGIQKGNGSGLFSSATYSDIFSLFTGCSGTMYPGYDGTCHSAGGSSPTFTNMITNFGLKCTIASGAMTCSITDVNGNTPSASSPVTIAVPNNPGAYTSYTVGSITSTLSITIPAAAQVGMLINANNYQNGYIYVYYMVDTTPDICVSGYDFSQISGTYQYISATAISGTANAYTTMYCNAAHTSHYFTKIARINANYASGSYSAPSDIQINKASAPATWGSKTGYSNGTSTSYGSSATKIRRIGSTIISGEVLGAVTCTFDSATQGSNCTITQPGIFDITYCDVLSAQIYYGISKNSTQQTTAFASLSDGSALIGVQGSTCGTAFSGCAHWIGRFPQAMLSDRMLTVWQPVVLIPESPSE